MSQTLRVLGLGLVAGLAAGVVAPGSEPTGQGRREGVPVRLTAAGKLSGRWLGQDRHDLCGAADAVKPNGYQDVHIALSGLPPAREVVAAWVNGHGSGEWRYRGVNGPYGAEIQRRPGSPTADLFFEPDRVETGREFVVRLKFDDGSEATATLRGGRADPNLRMPDAGLAARWVGQEKHDLTGPGPCVGPDGVQDAKIAISRLAPGRKVASVLLEAGPGARWSFGANPSGDHNAEFYPVEKDPTRATLVFQPDRDLAGQSLRVTVVYADGKKDSAAVVAGRTDPKLAMPAAGLPRLAPLTLKARWLGQDGRGKTGPGEVHVHVEGLPASRPVAAAVLSDSVRGVWVYKGANAPPLDPEPGAGVLGFKPGPGRSTADLVFAPNRDEKGATLTLRVVLSDGTQAFGTFPGGACDPALTAPAPGAGEALARPGDDLAALAARHGTVRIAKGRHNLTRPLVLPRPVSLVGEPGAVLVFSQPATEPPWTAAVKIHAGNTSLRDFAVRFEGRVRWKTDVSWGPAVIGTTDNLDGIPMTPKVNLTFSGLDLEGTEKSGSVPWEEAPRLIRAHGATCGKVVKNTLRGGLVHLFEGPWVVADNVYKGTQTGTFSHAVFVVHEPHDVDVRGNRAAPVGPSGKTWRFLIFVRRGANDRVRDNVIAGIGPRDDDTIPPANAPEIILTESYSLVFEGRPSALSADGRLLRVGRVAPAQARTGDVVSVLSGHGAGQWRRVAQRVEPDVYLLDGPLPRGAGAAALSITPGFVNDSYTGNSIDARDGRAAAGFVFAGNHFGTLVKNNRVVGAGDPFQVMSASTEEPHIWGWSHAPLLGVVLEGNVLEDSERGGMFGISHGGLCKSNKGRVYMTLALRNNTVRWSEAFLSRLGAKAPEAGITLGYLPSLDPGEFLVEESGNRLLAPERASTRPALKVNAATVNGRPITNRSLPLPAGREAASAGLGGAPASDARGRR